MKTIFHVALVALLAAGCGDPLFFAEVEEERICMTLHNQAIPATQPGDQTGHWEDDVDLGSKIPLLGTKGTTGSMKLLSLEITGSTDLRGIVSAAVAVAPSGGTQTTLARYTQPTSVPDPMKISIGVPGDTDLFPFLDAGKLHFAVDFAGNPPSEDWSADIDVCLSARIMVDALKAIQE